jgi:hypothetical protein
LGTEIDVTVEEMIMSATARSVFVATAFTILAGSRPARSQVPGMGPQPAADGAYVPPAPAGYGQVGVAPGAPQSYEQAGLPPSQVVQPTYSGPKPLAPPKAPADQHSGLFIMGNLGFHSYQGTTGTGLGAGLRLGGLAGWFVTPEISLNGELSLDILNFKSDTAAAQANLSGVRVQLSVSPFYHLVLPIGAELLFGPKLGVWDTSLSDTSDYSLSEKGYLFGLNAGMYFHIGPLAAGGLLTIEDGVPTSSCVEYAGVEEYCGTVSSATSDKVVSLAGSVFF